MIRESTPLPRRPLKEAELLDIMLKLLRFKKPMESNRIVTLVKKEFKQLGLPVPCAVDIRLMLQPPYFSLKSTGWVCKWRL